MRLPFGGFFLRYNQHNGNTIIIMKAVILAAGKGTRLGALTERVPKPMILLNGTPLLAHIIGELPDAVDEVIFVIGYRGEQIKEYFGNRWNGRRIVYVDGSDLTGTGGALFKAREALPPGEKFLVMNGDDFLPASDILALLAQPLAMGVFEGQPERSDHFTAARDAEGNLKGFHRPAPEELARGIAIATGAFTLDDRIFGYDPVPLKPGEFSLPFTVAALACDAPIRTVPMSGWRTITYPEDVPKMEDYLASYRRGR
jgi:UDP-N-acetylglucosamine diphosphorylase / glucose-1-phosphate thymidylyltransferase / UDP-N-acetylgalactosamine diphosphorylase / glucosamine-1-phosphate N-acetyltransferase / galactosamine-1-phosphate N-acetyltransferase